jgi:hypothetical protein
LGGLLLIRERVERRQRDAAIVDARQSIQKAIERGRRAGISATLQCRVVAGRMIDTPRRAGADHCASAGSMPCSLLAEDVELAWCEVTEFRKRLFVEVGLEPEAAIARGRR